MEWFIPNRDLSKPDFSKIMQLVTEINSKKFHEFSLLAIKNNKNQYLQIYDERWQCWLFPYVRSTDENKSNVDAFARKLLGTDVDMAYVTTAKHCKYSVSDQVYKIYNHKLYKAMIASEPAHLTEEDSKCRWMSIDELEADGVIMEKNDDIIAFVKTKCL